MRDFLDFLKTFKLHILIVVLLCFAHGMVRAGEAEKPLPADAQKAVAACDMAISKARAELVKGLKSSLAKATKAGDLAGANLVQARITETEKLLDDGKDLLGNKTPAASLVGMYTCDFWHRGEEIRITEKAIERIEMKGFNGTWVLAPNKLTLRWDNGGTTVCDVFDPSDRSWKESSSGFKLTPGTK